MFFPRYEVIFLINYLLLSFFINSAISGDDINNKNSGQMNVVSEVKGGTFHEFVVQINDYCTGTFIAPTVMITAEHCLGRTTKENVDSSDLVAYRGRISKGDFEDQYEIMESQPLSTGVDMALVTVLPPLVADPEDFPQVKSRSINDVSQKSISITGYPESADSHMMEGSGRASRATDTKISYFIKTEGGVSGAGLRLDSRSMELIGVHTGSMGKQAALDIYKYGVLFSEAEVDEISSYLENAAARDWSRQMEELRFVFEEPETYLRLGTCDSSGYGEENLSCESIYDKTRTLKGLVYQDDYLTSDSIEGASNSIVD